MKQLWILYSCIGTGAFLISFFLEFVIFSSITGQPAFAFCLTAVLESAKVLTVIFHRIIEDRKNYKIPDAVSYLNTFFKFGLVFLSLICSIALISKGMDRPNLEAARSNDQNLITTAFTEKIALVESQREKRLDKITSELKEKYQNRFQELDSHYLPKIQLKEQLRDAEFRNMRGGVRKGAYWNEHNRLLQELKGEYNSKKDVLIFAENNEFERNLTKIEAEFQNKIDSSLEQKETALSQISKGNYIDDERAKNRTVASFLATIDQGLGLGMQYLTFALFFSLLTSILLESTIYLSFSYVTMFYNNILNPVENEFDSIDQVNFSQEPGAQDATEEHMEPSNENLHAQPGGDPSMDQFYQDLQNHFHTSDTSDTSDFTDPCEREGG